MKKFLRKKVQVLVGDLTKFSFINSLSKRVSYVDNLINNAATRNDKHLHDIKKDFDEVIDLNFKSIFLLTQIFTKKMAKEKLKEL